MRLLMHLAIGVALLQSVLVQLEPGAPLRGDTPQKRDRVGGSAELTDGSARIRAAADGHNVALRVTTLSEPLRAAGIYFQACHDLYPRRVFVGPPDKIVNGWDDLTGPLPAGQSLHRLDVRHVVTVNP